MARLIKRAASLAIIACFPVSAVSGAAPTEAAANQSAPTRPATAADVKPDALVRDSKGVQVAKIVEMQGTNVVLDTGQTKIAVPLTFLVLDSQGILLTITADQFNAAIAKAHARAEAAKAAEAPQPSPPSQPQTTPPKH